MGSVYKNRVEAFSDGSAAAKALTTSLVVSGSGDFKTGPATVFTMQCTVSGTNATSVEIQGQWSMDDSTYAPLDVSNYVTAGTVSVSSQTCSISGTAGTYTLTIRCVPNTHLKLYAKRTGGDATTSLLAYGALTVEEDGAGEAASLGTSATSPQIVQISNGSAVTSATAPQFVELTNGSAAVALTATSPAIVQLCNGAAVHSATSPQPVAEGTQFEPVDGGGQAVNIGAAAARSTALTVGKDYDLYAEADCYVVAGGSSVDATTADYFLPLGRTIKYRPVTNKDYISVIRDATDVTGGLHICQASA